jgi:hypothetical protein
VTVDLRFRRQRLSRWADEALLDRLEAEHDELSDEDKAERNAFIDSAGDEDIREMLGEATEDDKKAKRRASASRRPSRATAPAQGPAAEAVDDAQPSGDGSASEE